AQGKPTPARGWDLCRDQALRNPAQPSDKGLGSRLRSPAASRTASASGSAAKAAETSPSSTKTTATPSATASATITTSPARTAAEQEPPEQNFAKRRR